MLRHAKATRFNLGLRLSGPDIELEVCDNGSRTSPTRQDLALESDPSTTMPECWGAAVISPAVPREPG